MLLFAYNRSRVTVEKTNPGVCIRNYLFTTVKKKKIDSFYENHWRQTTRNSSMKVFFKSSLSPISAKNRERHSSSSLVWSEFVEGTLYKLWFGTRKCHRLHPWSPFLESPETFRAHFTWHNSLCILRQEILQLFKFLFPLQRMKRSASRNKRGGVLRMAFRVRKVFGTFEKRAPAFCPRLPNIHTRLGSFDYFCLLLFQRALMFLPRKFPGILPPFFWRKKQKRAIFLKTKAKT